MTEPDPTPGPQTPGSSLRAFLAPGWIALAVSLVALALSIWAVLQPDVEVRGYLLRNPEVIEEAVTVLQTRRAEQARAAADTAIRQNLESLERDPRDFAVGPADAEVTVVQFFDYRCPYCKQIAPEFLELIEDNPDVRFVFKEWPILDRGEDRTSEYAARAALAAQAQGKYLPVHQALMAARSLDMAGVDAILQAQGVDMAAARPVAMSEETGAHLSAVARVAELISATGTPTFVVGGRMVELTGEDSLRRAIREAKRAAE